MLNFHATPMRPKLAPRGRSLALLAAFAPALAACQSVGLSTSVGPSRQSIQRSADPANSAGITVLPLTEGIARQVNIPQVEGNFAANLGDATPIGTRVGVGDVLEITIWEAAPAALFGGSSLDTRIGSPVQGGRGTTLPELLVGPSGTVTVPFAGQVPAAGRSLAQIEQDVVARLRGKAHRPQAIARIANRQTANVTVLGEVKDPKRLPLSPRGERLLDVIAQAGGTNAPLDRMTVEINRGDRVQRMAARDVIRDPRHNIILQSDDVVTLFHQPYSFTVLGAAGKNEEVRFEGVGISLSQALGRVGGLQDERADPRGVFLFRWEDAKLLAPATAAVGPASADGRIPVIYQVDMKEPATYFAAQDFQMRDGDVIYVSNSALADLQRFVNILAGSILPVATVRNTVR